jgi:hypothetical protein
MRPLFTVHAGEFLVGSEVERRWRGAHVWLPSKDTGLDLLVTNARNTRSISLQVKYSRDYAMFHRGFLACGWWTFDRAKLRASPADLWVLVLLPFRPGEGVDRTDIQYVIIPPKELASRLGRIHGRVKSFQSYLWVTKQKRQKRCWDVRGLSKKAVSDLADDRSTARRREFTHYLNRWELLARRLFPPA